MARAAKSLQTALEQLNRLCPDRNKASDGGIGDAAHAARQSDHNPDANGIYHARDFTHDPAHGADMNRFPLALMQDSRAKYVIWNDEFFDRDSAGRVRRRPYKQVNPGRTNKHDKHLHLSVWSGARGEDARQWGAFLPGGKGASATTPKPASTRGVGSLPNLEYGDSGPAVLSLQRFMVAHFPAYNRYQPTGNYLDKTTAGIKEFQRRVGITGPDANGRIVGPRTKAALYEYGWRG